MYDGVKVKDAVLESATFCEMETHQEPQNPALDCILLSAEAGQLLSVCSACRGAILDCSHPWLWLILSDTLATFLLDQGKAFPFL